VEEQDLFLFGPK
jgi:hypothetical protein